MHEVKNPACIGCGAMPGEPCYRESWRKCLREDLGGRRDGQTLRTPYFFDILFWVAFLVGWGVILALVFHKAPVPPDHAGLLPPKHTNRVSTVTWAVPHPPVGYQLAGD